MPRSPGERPRAADRGHEQPHAEDEETERASTHRSEDAARSPREVEDAVAAVVAQVRVGRSGGRGRAATLDREARHRQIADQMTLAKPSAAGERSRRAGRGGRPPRVAYRKGTRFGICGGDLAHDDLADALAQRREVDNPWEKNGNATYPTPALGSHALSAGVS